MPEMMKEVVVALDAESRELAQQLADDLREMLAVAPAWAAPVAEGVAELRSAAKQQKSADALQALLTRVSGLANDLASLKTNVASAASQAQVGGLLTAQEQEHRGLAEAVQAVSDRLDTVKSSGERAATLLAEQHSIFGALHTRLVVLESEQKAAEALLPVLTKVNELANDLASLQTTVASAASQTQVGSLLTAQEQDHRGFADALRLVAERLDAVKSSGERAAILLAEQHSRLGTIHTRLVALESESKSHTALLQRLNRPWYRRIFGG